MANLLAWFEFYLLATFVLGLVQLRHHAALYGFVLRAPRRWPRLAQIAKENLRHFLTWSTIVSAGVAWTVWLSHLLLRRFVYPGASVSLEQLSAHQWLLIVAIILGTTMLVLDARALFRVARFRAPRTTWLLDLTELALTSEVAVPLKWYLGWHVRFRLMRRMPLVNRWIWKRSAEMSARLAVGLTLWSVWLGG